MRAIHARVGCSKNAAGQSLPCSSSSCARTTLGRPHSTPNRRMTASRAFQTSLGDGKPRQDHNGSEPVVIPLDSSNDNSSSQLRLVERAGRVYARVSVGGGGGGDSSNDDGFEVFPPPSTGVFYAGSELRPDCDYLLSPGGAVLTLDDSRSLTVTYEVKDDGSGKSGIGALGEMLARSMVAQSSDEVKAKLDDVF